MINNAAQNAFPLGESRPLRDRSAEILQRASKIAAERREQQKGRKARIEGAVERLASFVHKVQAAGILKTLREYPQIRLVDQSHIFSFSYRRMHYTIQVDAASGQLVREMTMENDPAHPVRSQNFEEDRALDDMVEYIAIMIAKIQLQE